MGAMTRVLTHGSASSLTGLMLAPRGKWRGRLTLAAALVLAVWLMASSQLSVYKNITGPTYLADLWREQPGPRVLAPNATCSEVRWLRGWGGGGGTGPDA